MKSFRNFIKEEVLPTAQVVDGSIDIEKPNVRAAINAAIAGVTSQPAITPYITYVRLSKLLSRYHIILPRRFMEGDKGVEVFDVRQFGTRMGMTNDGEFVSNVPTKFYLFVRYNLDEPHDVSYVRPTAGGMFQVSAKLVDEIELNKLLSSVETALKEDAEQQLQKSKMLAPREQPRDISTDGSPSTTSDVAIMMRKNNKKLSASSLSEEDINEAGMPASVIKHKQKIANMSPEKKKEYFKGKSPEQLQRMAERHGYGKGSSMYSRYGSSVKEQTDDEDTNSDSQQRQSERELSEERKRTASVADAFLKGQKANQRTLRTDGKSVTYHGNTIAKHEGDEVHVTTAGHAHSPSTRGHINGILSRLGSDKLSVKKGQLHHGKNPVDHDAWIKVKKPQKATFGEGVVTGPRSFKGSADRKRKAVQMALGRKHKDHPDWNPRTNPQNSALVLGRQLQKQGVKEEKGDKLTVSNMKDVKDSDVNKNMGYSTVPKGDNMPQSSTPPVGTKFTNRRPEYEPQNPKSSTSQNPYAPGGSMYETAPPGAKYERMVKHIKKGYSKGGLTSKEKSIAYATAWKAKKRQDEELKFDPSSEIPKNT